MCVCVCPESSSQLPCQAVGRKERVSRRRRGSNSVGEEKEVCVCEFVCMCVCVCDVPGDGYRRRPKGRSIFRMEMTKIKRRPGAVD